ncbi:MAG: hypothetical protein GY800_04090 [Planctomycetes bacterium]|nr:hypothetical protein [Planctomycetota bacterium]
MEDTVCNNSYYQCYSNAGKSIFVYENHRFIVPILWLAQSKNIITYPINFVYFDHHLDALVEQRERKKIASDIEKAKTFDDVFKIVYDNLSIKNDTWLRLLMDLEIVKDAVVMGDVEATLHEKNKFEKFSDLKENEHLLKNMYSLGGTFESQGDLIDLARRPSLESLWAILGWKYDIQKKDFVMHDTPPILLDFDLDYFTFRWREWICSWRDDFYSKEYDMPSTHYTKAGWNGEKFLNKLIKRAPFVTIAKESRCCGGQQESNSVLKELSNKFFSGAIRY